MLVRIQNSKRIKNNRHTSRKSTPRHHERCKLCSKSSKSVELGTSRELKAQQRTESRLFVFIYATYTLNGHLRHGSGQISMNSTLDVSFFVMHWFRRRVEANPNGWLCIFIDHEHWAPWKTRLLHRYYHNVLQYATEVHPIHFISKKLRLKFCCIFNHHNIPLSTANSLFIV